MALLDLNDPTLFRQQAFIAGIWCDGQDSQRIDVDNPATGGIIGSVPACTAQDTQKAVEAARIAQLDWKRKTGTQRAEVLATWYQLVMDNVEDLATIMTAEQGKVLAEARGEVRYAASFLKWYAEEARRSEGSILSTADPARRVLVLKQPIGVTAAITPWNFPLAMITRKCGPAIAAGCSMVIKPSELTPFSALALAVLGERAGLPTGLLSVITGLPAAVGKVLTESPVVRKLTFTGSTGVGKILLEQSASTVKKCSMELGGNAPFLVFDDADVDATAEGIMQSKFRNAGQTCVCANRVLVQDGIWNRLLEAVMRKVEALQVGAGMDAGSTIGPLINESAVAKVRAHVEDALSKGARYVGAPLRTEGRFVWPVVLEGVTTEMRVAHEETFGPVLPLFRFKMEEEAVNIANNTPFGLASYFFTNDIRRLWRVGEALEFGMIGHNTGAISMESVPFGGVKESGLGREGGHAGMEEFMETKSLHLGGLDV
ncbi:aldehyde dehydrogenase family protein [Acetobacter fabarum]|uniref:NAD-dependent succinate-semialdehyde dehydrogenase n=1 Tax=Acetobacter fabarum TaxID=483199 RepID=UPI001404B764|nr:NAD-dependent succinate-semialdehyde dehydrogenase [Acetobacter fabarum]NHO42309.1 aldehyde dehydrogenase family protein [Acetobacter fabarum]GBQ37940.1 aldehyde/betaine dehydrogenase [Acetobacter fabarum DSM 19596]